MTARTLDPFDPALVAPWRLGEGRRGALLLHGFAGTPPELRRLGEHLARHGWCCYAPALPGHAAEPADLMATSWSEWAAGVAAAMHEMAERCDTVVVAGQSMGAALALHLAAADHRVAAVASLAAPLWLRGLLPHLLPVIQHVVRWHRSGSDVDLWDLTAVDELWSYGLRSTHAINELRGLLGTVRDELAQVRAPVLVLHGGRDRMVDPRCSSEVARRLVCSAEVRHAVLPRSGHAMSVDVDRDAINALVLEWFERHAAGVSSQPLSATG